MGSLNFVRCNNVIKFNAFITTFIFNNKKQKLLLLICALIASDFNHDLMTLITHAEINCSCK